MRRGRRSTWVRRATDGDGAFLVLIAPAFILLFAITVVPLVMLLWTSLQEWNRASPDGPTMVWFGNYTDLLTNARFWKAASLTAYQVGGTVSVQLILGLAIALLFCRRLPGINVARSAYLVPMMCTPVVVGLMWKMMLQTDHGPINTALRAIGLPGPDWLGDQRLAMPSIILADVWLSTPFVVIILVAGLQSVPAEIIEAARVDGASSWQILRRITIPVIKPMIVLAVLFRTMDAIKRFDTIYIMTGGGPGNATETLDLHAFAYAFTYLDVGTGAAVATLMLGLIIIVSALLLRLMPNDN